ncbi:MAG TPA: CehA/McbA family metallohydrolase [Polyangiaceae bacterium]|nr:CehA/McbA family metallohydrolase [Polyangiaceae bacterium]
MESREGADRFGRVLERKLIAALVGIPVALVCGAVFGVELERTSRIPDVLAAPRGHFERTFEVTRFQRGNVHTHTTLSDGSSSPERTILWYRTHGYNFLALTDHNILSSRSRYVFFEEPGFTLIPGEEITMRGHGRQVHVNALCTATRIAGGDFATASAALSSAITQVDAQNGVAIVNHPNFDWALTPADVVGAGAAALLEIASGHPYVHTAGDVKHPSHEKIWDIALSEGASFMGVAVDDVHTIDVSHDPPAIPGRGWVQVFADHADRTEICDALRTGRLYATTGAELQAISVTGEGYRVTPKDVDATVTFIGASGAELAKIPTHGSDAVYVPRGDEGYVRARVENAGGKQAWTPAVRVHT